MPSCARRSARSTTLERAAYRLLLSVSSHDISVMRELLGMPDRVLHATARHGGQYLTATFDYGSFVCQFETGIDEIPRFDCHIEVYADERVVRLEYDTPYVRNLPTRVVVLEANGRGGVHETTMHTAWGDAFVSEWRAFHRSVTEGVAPRTSAADFSRTSSCSRRCCARWARDHVANRALSPPSIARVAPLM